MADAFIHTQALCESEQIGENSRVLAFAHVLAGARIGVSCEVGDGAFVDRDSSIGDRVKIGGGVRLVSGVTLCDDVVVGANATFSSEPHRRGAYPDGEQPSTVVNAGASIGANATILAGVEIGRGASVSAGAVVTRSVPPNALVVGNPAYIVGYSETRTVDTSEQRIMPRQPATVELDVRGVRLERFAEYSDLRGSLTVGDLPDDAIPFAPRRWFLVYDVPNQEVRGEHAHRVCHQFLICVSGSMTVAVDDGERRTEVTLDSPTLGLYVPPLVWASQFHYGPDSVLLVLASHPYDASDYIRDYELFLAAATAA
jgi:UDP-2-acetamido-3-amino-2,3-dideoxy-glucuronate N-acetyltransferase